MGYIEDICFFEVNPKYISSNELKVSEFSRVRSTSENFDVFNSRDEIFLVFTEKKQIFFLFYTIHGHFKYIWYSPKKSKFSFYFIQYTGIFLFTKQAVKMRKQKIFENTNNFGTTLFLTF